MPDTREARLRAALQQGANLLASGPMDDARPYRLFLLALDAALSTVEAPRETCSFPQLPPDESPAPSGATEGE